MDIQIIIMAGGVGSRFWPMSTPDYPKQFIDVMGVGRSLIQLTVDRLKPICPVENMWVVTNEKYIRIVKEQIPDMPVDNIWQCQGRQRHSIVWLQELCDSYSRWEQGRGSRLDGYIVAENHGQLLVCELKEEQRIKEFISNGNTNK